MYLLFALVLKTALPCSQVPLTCCVLEEDGKDPQNPQPVSTTLCMTEALVPNMSQNTQHLYVKVSGITSKL